jgi:uncharacterized SAM-binding protein YcdF (DUF218 family)
MRNNNWVIRTLLIIAGIALLLDTVVVLLLSNYHLGYLASGIISVVLILYGIFYRRIPKSIHILASIIAIAILSMMIFLGVYGNWDNATYEEDAIIVLGASVRGEQVSRVLAKRLDVAVAYFEKNPDVMIVVSGAQGPQEYISEAQAMKRYLIANGIPEQAIIEEDRSTSTLENLRYSKELLDECFPSGFSSVIVTNSFHVYRTMHMAQIADIPSAHMGSLIEWYSVPMNYLREVLAVLALWLLPGYGN